MVVFESDLKQTELLRLSSNLQVLVAESFNLSLQNLLWLQNSLKFDYNLDCSLILIYFAIEESFGRTKNTSVLPETFVWRLALARIFHSSIAAL